MKNTKLEELEKAGIIEPVGFIYKTNDHSIFKTLETNRSVDSRRKSKIGKSIDDNGYIEIPISVNENLEIIDGQGRESCLSDRDIPTIFHVVHGAGTKECQVLNINHTSWNAVDYIKSYASDESFDNNASYKTLLYFIELFKNIPKSVVFMVVAGNWNADNTSRVIAGTFVSKADETTIETLEFLDSIRPFISKAGGNRKLLYTPILYAIKEAGLDKNRLANKLERFCSNINVVDTQGAFESIEDIYNRNIRGDKIPLWFPYSNGPGKNGRVHRRR